jgi:flavin reductase (DIM6/NTAB) family NADH-FMN oxidoreductase RutF
MTKKSFPLSRVYRLLEPGPVVLVTTAHNGKTNIMTQSWHTMMEFEPPLVGCVISAVGWVIAASPSRAEKRSAFRRMKSSIQERCAGFPFGG